MSYRRLAEALLAGKPYFGPALRALQGVAERLKFCLPIVKAAARAERVEILEVGSWAGASAIAWGSALRSLGLGGHVTCVDPWLPYFDLAGEHAPHYRQMNRAAESGFIRRLFEHNIACSGLQDTIQAREGKSCEVLPQLPPHSFDIVYLDGSHRYEDVRLDLQHAKRLIRDGGIICGDDLELQLPNLNAVEVETFALRGQDYVASHGAGCDYHPGVTLAVWQELGEVSVWEGFWAIAFSGGSWRKPEIDLTRVQVPEHTLTDAIRFEADTHGFSIVSSQGQFYAVARQLGTPDIAAEFLADEDVPPLVYRGGTLQEVRDKIASAEFVEASPEGSLDLLSPELLGDYRGFNLVRFRRRAYGVRKSLGIVDLAAGDTALAEKYAPSDVAIRETVDAVRAAIDQTETECFLHGLAHSVEKLAADVLELRQQAGRAGEISTARSGDANAEQNANELAESVPTAAAQSDEAGGDTDGRQSSNGPAVLLELYRGFKLVRYGGRTYGIRAQLGDLEALLGDTVLEAKYSGEDVLSAESSDVVKARIDALEAERAVRALAERFAGTPTSNS